MKEHDKTEVVRSRNNLQLSAWKDCGQNRCVIDGGGLNEVTSLFEKEQCFGLRSWWKKTWHMVRRSESVKHYSGAGVDSFLFGRELEVLIR